MQRIITSVLYTIITLAIFSSCKKESATPAYNEKKLATLSIQFDNIVGEKNLQLNTGVYTNASGEQFSVSTLQYYISNIKVTTSGGQAYTVPQDSSYFLVSESSATSQFVKVKVPEGEYATLSFVLGVDSLRSTAKVDKRTGVLDPAGEAGGNMYWSWNSGYIFFKMEGSSAVAPGDKKFRYHIGGFGGYSAPTINNLKTIDIQLTAAGVAKVRQDREANIHLMVDVMKVFNGPTNVSIAQNATVMFGDFSKLIANNYTAMFRHDHTEN
ncbi:hypothetical protein KTO58_26280 [Chitinophaga pendula]|nr:hypothetical protein CK934_02490 [Chitinophaga sp. MD30]UCJ10363.1 hypothetical protein KTO58_26280 [Chitinophaga pendula]